MKARNQFGLKVGDVCAIDLDAILCGGPRTGLWKEHRARPWKEYIDDIGRYVVTGTHKEGDMITGSTFSMVEVEPLETRNIHCHGHETSPGSGMLHTEIIGRLPLGSERWAGTIIPDDHDTMVNVCGEFLSRVFGKKVHASGGGVTGGDDRETCTRSVFFEVEVAVGV